MTVSLPTTLLGALTAALDASALAADLAAAGGVWVGGIPEDKTALPFLAILHHGEVPTFGPPGQVDEEGRFDLVVVQRGLAAAETLAAEVKDLFDPTPQTTPGGYAELQMDGVVLAYVVRTDYRVRLVPERAADSTRVYEITLPYTSFVTRHA